MKKSIMLIAALCMTSVMTFAQKVIRVSTDKTDLVMKVSPKGRLYQVYLGDKLLNPSDYDNLKWDVYAASDGAVCQRGHEVYATSGAEDFFEPAVAATHADGNMTTYLYYKSSEQKPVDGGTETVITLQDKVYPFTVKLHYVAYAKENVIKAWSEISHNEKSPVTLWRYSSTMLYFKSSKYFLTNYHSDWAKEGQPETTQLSTGKKIIDTKLGTRAAMQAEPFFELGFDEPAKENEGKVMLGTIGWPGNFRFTFEVDNVGALRVIPAINPYASDYKLKAGEVFTTPEFIFAMSNNGMGEASRNLHNWARQYQVNMGMDDRLTLLNNWENTGFDFNQQSLAELMKDAKDLGVDMFLLDDGWFANKYPRKDDHAGLGDWEATKSKLPEGIPGLVRDAKKAGVKFGIWIEPEMGNWKASELYDKHPDWFLQNTGVEPVQQRGGTQARLDLCNPKVQDFVVGVVDRLMTDCPELAYIKWDDNAITANYGSTYLGSDRQSQIYTGYHLALRKVLERIRAKYPDLVIQGCASGGGRVNYGLLPYFDEFWTSDNTDALQRVYIQWGTSQFFPANAMAAHVSAAPNHQTQRTIPLKFRFDVAEAGRLGIEMRPSDFTTKQLAFAQQAVEDYKRLRPVIQLGDLYRLLSPYEQGGVAASHMYVSADKGKAVVYAYKLKHFVGHTVPPIRMQGLDPNRSYRIKELNKVGNSITADGKLISGKVLMEAGLALALDNEYASRMVELTAE